METLQHAQLQEYAGHFEALKEEARVLVDGMSNEAFNWRPEPGRWSVGECLDHLNATGRLLLPGLDDAIARARERGMTGDGPFDYGWLGTWWVKQMQPSPRRRLKAPGVFKPSSSTLDEGEVVQAFVALQDDLIARVRAADGLDLRRVKAPSAVTSLLRLPIGAWMESTVAHQRRHLAQARRVVAHTGFPAIEG